jgi:glycosyltransferase involved in cell wall biosynthesis
MRIGRIVGFIFCYNERDIIGETLQFYEERDIPVVVVDNGSTDGTEEVARGKLHGEVLEYVRWETAEYDLKSLLDLCLATVKRHCPEWIMHIDADHFYEPGDGFASFANHVEDAEKRDCNVIDFEEYVFLPTTTDDPSIESVYKRVKHYAYRIPGIAKRPSSYGPQVLQPRLYRYQPGMNISEDGAHTIFYASDVMRIHPVKGILRHYMFRSVEHARHKLQQRRARYSRAGRARGWHTQYDNWPNDDRAFCHPPDSLCRRVEGAAWSKEFVLLADGSVERRETSGEGANNASAPETDYR